jgi:hypothetical protein
MKDGKDDVVVIRVTIVEREQRSIRRKLEVTIRRGYHLLHGHDSELGAQMVELPSEASDVQTLDPRISRSREVPNVVVHHNGQRLRHSDRIRASSGSHAHRSRRSER